MKRVNLLLLLLAILASSLVSCTSLTPTVAKVQKVTKPVKTSLAKVQPKRFKFPSFKRKVPPIIDTNKALASRKIERTKIVKAKSKPSKKKTAKKKTSKADRLAWNRKKKAEEKKSRKSKKEKALVPKDFEASDLDLDGQIPSYGILPSLNPGSINAINDLDDGGLLPPDIANLPQIPELSAPSSTPDLSSVPDYLKPVGPVPVIKTGE